MSIEGYLLLLLILVGLYWLGYKINPPIDEGHPIVPEPNQMLMAMKFQAYQSIERLERAVDARRGEEE